MKPAVIFDYRDGDFRPHELCRRDGSHTVWKSHRRDRAQQNLREWCADMLWKVILALVCVAFIWALYIIAEFKY
jgi:hypothetical protein